VIEYSEQYLVKNFDGVKFFDPECQDKRAREINMRAKRCLECSGLEDCKLYPNFWPGGEMDRLKMNEVMDAEEGPAEVE
jgi:hypothetical protein